MPRPNLTPQSGPSRKLLYHLDCCPKIKEAKVQYHMTRYLYSSPMGEFRCPSSSINHTERYKNRKKSQSHHRWRLSSSFLCATRWTFDPNESMKAAGKAERREALQTLDHVCWDRGAAALHTPGATCRPSGHISARWHIDPKWGHSVVTAAPSITQ